MPDAPHAPTGGVRPFGLSPKPAPEAVRRPAALAAVLPVAALLAHSLVQPSLPVFADATVFLGARPADGGRDDVMWPLGCFNNLGRLGLKLASWTAAEAERWWRLPLPRESMSANASS